MIAWVALLSSIFSWTAWMQAAAKREVYEKKQELMANTYRLAMASHDKLVEQLAERIRMLEHELKRLIAQREQQANADPPAEARQRA